MYTFLLLVTASMLGTTHAADIGFKNCYWRYSPADKFTSCARNELVRGFCSKGCGGVNDTFGVRHAEIEGDTFI